MKRHGIRVCLLMGGSGDNDLTLMPDEPAILVGTQDLLLSRALNRGYARNPFRWPIDFALLHNDCEWFLDEVQLLGDGMATSTQLAAFHKRFGVFGPARTCWMSATFPEHWLETVDFRPLRDRVAVIAIGPDDLENETVQRRIHAEKALERAPEDCRTPKGTAEWLAEHHRPGTLSLCIANTVERAVEIRAALRGRVAADVRLLHSRFRAADRATHLDAVLSDRPPEGRIVVATQVIEAGMDVDAALLITDAAPWASLVQRFGRVNRKGEQSGCRIAWVDLPLRGNKKQKDRAELFAPYELAEVEAACAQLEGLRSAAPAGLPETAGNPVWRHVVRRTDLFDLFDTSSDLGGNQLDISRFVRSGEDREVYIAWREWKDEEPPREELEDGELCPVPRYEIGTKPRELQQLWVWNPTESQWRHPEHVYPGMTLLVHSRFGRYTPESGWSQASKSPVEPVPPQHPTEAEGMVDERQTYRGHRQLLEGHTEDVCREMARLLEVVSVDPYRAAMERAARLHDWGKAHPVMQQTLHDVPGLYAGTEILAKQERAAARHGGHSMPYFRHELASALAMLAAGENPLAAYVAAAHHGRVRVAVRSMPGERANGAAVIRGLKSGDVLLPCRLGGGEERGGTVLSLDAAVLGESSGGESWTAGVLALLERLGPFRLAYLEMLLRAADERASELAAKEATECAT